MNGDDKGRRLGRGLSALLGEEPSAASAALTPPTAGARNVPIEQLRPNPFQPRKSFDPDELAGLAQSLRKNGMLQPILVRPAPHDPTGYEIVAGERRWRAAQQAQLHDVPVVSRALSHSEALEISLVENLQRQDLNALEEADAFRRLLEEFDYTQEQLAQGLGKSRSHIANMIRLLGLPDEVKQALEAGSISAGHARALLGASDPLAVLKVVLARGLTVRATEALVKTPPSRRARRPEKDADTRALEARLSTTLGLEVALDRRRNGAGDLRIRYQSLDQLDEVCRRLGVSTVPA